jgi:hypothetical protein
MPLGFGNGDCSISYEADANQSFMWERVDANATNNCGGINQGDETLSAIGLKILRNDSSLTEATIKYKILPKDLDKVMLGMFVASAGEGRKADLEIRFQEDYKGKEFYIPFKNGLVMRGVFDPKYSIGSPAYLELGKSDATKVSRIIDLIDANLSDNNLTTLDHFSLTCDSLHCENNSIVTGGRQKLINGSITTYDLSFVAQFSADFPTNGPLYILQKAASDLSAPDIIVGGVTRSDRTILCRQADLTVPVGKQRTALSRFNIYKLHKDRGYWVYMDKSGAQNAVFSGAKSLSSKVTRSYSNGFDGNGSNALAATRNEIRRTYRSMRTDLTGCRPIPLKCPKTSFCVSTA